MNSFKCKGCRAAVAKPILCDSCGIASHPRCIDRTGHPNANGRFLDCGLQANAGGNDVEVPDESIRSFIKSEFDKIRKEFNKLKEELLVSLHDIKTNMQALTARIDVIEDNVASFPMFSEEDIISEIGEREVRGKNLILFNVDDTTQSEREDGNHDMARVQDLIQSIGINNINILKTTRIGRRNPDKIRPLCVCLSSVDEARSILRNKHKQTGKIRISQDRTIKQREHLKNLKLKLRSMIAAGETNKTIKYINGIPIIVDSHGTPASKN